MDKWWKERGKTSSRGCAIESDDVFFIPGYTKEDSVRDKHNGMLRGLQDIGAEREG